MVRLYVFLKWLMASMPFEMCFGASGLIIDIGIFLTSSSVKPYSFKGNSSCNSFSLRRGLTEAFKWPYVLMSSASLTTDAIFWICSEVTMLFSFSQFPPSFHSAVHQVHQICLLDLHQH